LSVAGFALGGSRYGNRIMAKTIAKQAAIGDDYSASFHQVEF
jgi:hypothetical protein